MEVLAFVRCGSGRGNGFVRGFLRRDHGRVEKWQWFCLCEDIRIGPPSSQARQQQPLLRADLVHALSFTLLPPVILRKVTSIQTDQLLRPMLHGSLFLLSSYTLFRHQGVSEPGLVYFIGPASKLIEEGTSIGLLFRLLHAICNIIIRSPYPPIVIQSQCMENQGYSIISMPVLFFLDEMVGSILIYELRWIKTERQQKNVSMIRRTPMAMAVPIRTEVQLAAGVIIQGWVISTIRKMRRRRVRMLPMASQLHRAKLLFLNANSSSQDRQCTVSLFQNRIRHLHFPHGYLLTRCEDSSYPLRANPISSLRHVRWIGVEHSQGMALFYWSAIAPRQNLQLPVSSQFDPIESERRASDECCLISMGWTFRLRFIFKLCYNSTDFDA